jgi:phage-related protein|nr:MAG TPA: minor tail protein [Caudoviricetes sp.]
MANADGSIIFSTEIDNKKAQAELDKLEKKIASLEIKASQAGAKKIPLEEQADSLGVALDDAKQKLEALKASGASPGAIGAQSETVTSLQYQWDQVNNKIDRYNREIEKANGDIDVSKSRAGELAAQLASAGRNTEKMSAGVKKAEKSAKTFASRMKSVVRSALVFTVITQALSKFRNWIGDVIKVSPEATAAIARLKGALLTLVQPLVNIIIPAFTKFVNILAAIINKIASVFAVLTGKTVESSKAAAEALNKQTSALNGTGAAAKEAKKQLLGFDEINQLTEDTSGGGGGSGTIAPDFSGFDDTEDELNTILGLVGAIATGLLAWKIASLFTDSLSMIGGIALAAAGAFALVYFWLDAWNNGIDMQNFLGMLAGAAALAGGLAIAFGSTAAGIALVIGGLAMLVVGIKDVIENGFTLENTLTIIAGLLAAGLGIGLLTGNWIPLLIAGIAAALIALVSFTGHGEELINGLKETIDGFGKFFKGVFSGDMEMTAEGLKQIWDGLKNTWNAIIDSIRDAWNMFIEWLRGKNPELAAIFETYGKLVSDLYNSVKQILGGIITFISGVFTGDWDKAWEGVKQIFKGIWNGIVSILEGAVNLIIGGINWMIRQLNKIQIKAPDWLGGGTIGFNIPAISTVSIPRLAQGAVIPPNREFMAVLGDQKNGTNVEAPLETIKQALAEVLSQNGSGEEITIKFTGDLATLARVLTPEITRQQRRTQRALGV